MAGEDFQKHGGASSIDMRVMGNLIHALTHTDSSGQVKDGIDTLECARDTAENRSRQL